VIQCALKLLALTFVRPGELRGAEWVEWEIDLHAAEWRIPAERMKMRVAHIVPLSQQAVEILHDLYSATWRGRYVFRGPGEAWHCQARLGAARLGLVRQGMGAGTCLAAPNQWELHLLLALTGPRN
jgi:integrase